MPRLGAFHISCCFLAVIGKRFEDAVLTDLLIESEVSSSDSISAVIEGRQYNRGVRAHKIVMEALWSPRWKSFGIWLAEQIKTLIKKCLWVSSATSGMTCQM